MNTGENERLAQVLDEMEKKLPRKYIPLDYRLLSDIASLYKLAGKFERFLEIADEIEPLAEKDRDKNPGDVSSFYNPYRILLQIYEGRGDIYKEQGLLDRAKTNYQMAINLLNGLRSFVSDGRMIDTEVNRFMQKMNFENINDTTGQK